jgi:hypothetical protein
MDFVVTFCFKPLHFVSAVKKHQLDPLRKSAVLKPRVKSKGLMHWNYPDFNEIHTVHLSNVAFMFINQIKASWPVSGLCRELRMYI